MIVLIKRIWHQRVGILSLSPLTVNIGQNEPKSLCIKWKYEHLHQFLTKYLSELEQLNKILLIRPEHVLYVC